MQCGTGTGFLCATGGGTCPATARTATGGGATPALTVPGSGVLCATGGGAWTVGVRTGGVGGGTKGQGLVMGRLG